MKNARFIPILGLIMLLILTGFGVQNCNKKDNLDPMAIVGEWRPVAFVHTKNEVDLSVCTPEDVKKILEDRGFAPLFFKFNQDKTGIETTRWVIRDFTWFHNTNEGKKRNSYVLRDLGSESVRESVQLVEIPTLKKDQLLGQKSYKLLFYPENVPAPKTNETTLDNGTESEAKNSKIFAECLRIYNQITKTDLITEYEKQ